MSFAERALVVLAAAAGLLGIALAAGAAHVTGGTNLDTAARFLLAHAPALLAVAALVERGAIGPRLGRLAGFTLAVGLALFCGDLSLRAFRGEALFRLAAPTGGVILMIGWALVGLAALAGRPRA
jgi:uncharacterized membrane protein YgdD (TMEM256/DUF423 family)